MNGFKEVNDRVDFSMGNVLKEETKVGELCPCGGYAKYELDGCF